MGREREESKGGEGRKQASNRGMEKEETRDLKNNKDKIAKLKVK